MVVRACNLRTSEAEAERSQFEGCHSKFQASLRYREKFVSKQSKPKKKIKHVLKCRKSAHFFKDISK